MLVYVAMAAAAVYTRSLGGNTSEEMHAIINTIQHDTIRCRISFAKLKLTGRIRLNLSHVEK